MNYIKELEKLGISEDDIKGEITRWKPPALKNDKSCLSFLNGYFEPDAGGCEDIETFERGVNAIMRMRQPQPKGEKRKKLKKYLWFNACEKLGRHEWKDSYKD